MAADQPTHKAMQVLVVGKPTTRQWVELFRPQDWQIAFEPLDSRFGLELERLKDARRYVADFFTSSLTPTAKWRAWSGFPARTTLEQVLRRVVILDDESWRLWGPDFAKQLRATEISYLPATFVLLRTDHQDVRPLQLIENGIDIIVDPSIDPPHVLFARVTARQQALLRESDFTEERRLRRLAITAVCSAVFFPASAEFFGGVGVEWIKSRYFSDQNPSKPPAGEASGAPTSDPQLLAAPPPPASHGSGPLRSAASEGM